MLQVESASPHSGGFFDYETKKERLEEVDLQLENPDLWNNPEEAQALGQERIRLEEVIAGLDQLLVDIDDGAELLELAEMEEDDGAMQEVSDEVKDIVSRIEKMEFRRMFRGEADSANAFIDIQSGSGGTEAQDWAEMLFRMYTRWGEDQGYKIDLIEKSPGDVAGIKSATLKMTGEYAYGHLRTETGVHRLVRKKSV